MKALLTLCVSLFLLGGALGASAGVEADPEIVDQTGDANYLYPAPDPDPTTPGSMAAVDLTKVWYTTRYVTVKDRDGSGAIIRVRYVPDALILNIQTAGPKRVVYAGGYELGFHIQARAQDGCALALYASVDPDTGGPLQALVSGCHTGSAVNLTSAALSFSGNTLKMTMPLTAVPFLGAGVTIQPGGVTDPVSARSAFLLNQYIDVAVGGRAFTVGQDVPADVDCTIPPAPAVCS